VGSLDFGLIACRRAVPDVDAIAQRLVQAFDALDGDADRGAARTHAPPDRPVRRRRAVSPGDDR
jgi:hypothetical protein